MSDSINDPIALVEVGKGRTMLSAELANAVIRLCNAIKNIKADPQSGLAVVLSENGILIDASPIANPPQVGSGAVQLAQFVSDGDNAFTANLLSGVTITNSGGSWSAVGTIIGTVQVAKPFNLQRQNYDGLTLTDPILGTQTVTYVSAAQRTFGSTTQYIDPPYEVSDLIMVSIPSGGTGVIAGGVAVQYQDMNYDAREWLAASGGGGLRKTISSDGDEYVTCSDGTQVYKPDIFRKSIYNGNTYTYPDGSHTYAYVNSHMRTDTVTAPGVGSTAFNEVQYPPYQSGQVITVIKASDGNYYDITGGRMWQAQIPICYDGTSGYILTGAPPTTTVVT